MMLSYRDKQLARVDIGAMFKMQGNDPSYPVFGSGPNKGMHMPLYNQLGSNPKMQSLMSDLTDRILTADSKTLDIQAIFADTQKKAREMSGTDDNTADGNLMALQAMATLSNYYKARGPDGSCRRSWPARSRRSYGRRSMTQERRSPTPRVPTQR